MTVWSAPGPGLPGPGAAAVASALVVGHRGGRGEGWPAENTLAAFDQARTQGARAIELDVRTTAGGDVVVFHDETLERMTAGGDVRPISTLSLGELQRVDIGRGARVPLLAEVLAWARSFDVAVNVEMKHEVASRPALARRTQKVVREARADVLLSSFDPLLLAMAGAFDPRVPRALLTHAKQDRWADVLAAAVRPPAVQAVHIERTQAGPRVGRYLQKGLRVGAWTVNDPLEGRALAESGVASIITDHAGEMIAALC
ncbi:MAG: glycerophosphodiester phosphodiesterase [Polyangiaceae bacterium]